MNLINKLRSRNGTQLLISIWFILMSSIKYELCFSFFIVFLLHCCCCCCCCYFVKYFFLEIDECSLDKIEKPTIFSFPTSFIELTLWVEMIHLIFLVEFCKQLNTRVKSIERLQIENIKIIKCILVIFCFENSYYE